MKERTRYKFDASEVDGLIAQAQLGDIESRDELVFRFKSLIASLVNTCLTGKSFTFSQKSFLRLWGRKSTDLRSIGDKVRITLSPFDKTELFHAGTIAILEAIEISDKNLTATIVYKFAEQLKRMVDEEEPIIIPTPVQQEAIDPDFIENIEFSIFIESLTEEEFLVVSSILEGNSVSSVPESLKVKLLERNPWILGKLQCNQ
jgi:hypothetical protein